MNAKASQTRYFFMSYVGGNMSEQRPWYTNKDLFEQINSMRGDFRDLSNEMQKTRKLLKSITGCVKKSVSLKQK